MMDLDNLKGKTFAEALADLYQGQTVEVYFGESSGSNHYSDYDVENKVYTTGEIVGAIGDMIIMDVTVQTPSDHITKRLSLNGWSITGVMPVEDDKIHITYLFKETKR